MSAPKLLSKTDLAIYIDEVAARVSNGQSTEKIAKYLNWAVEDVHDLMALPEFRAKLESLDPEALASLNIPDSVNVGLAEAVDFVAKRTLKYLQHLDQLADNAVNEGVKLNAIKELLTYTPVKIEAAKSEAVKISEDDIKRFLEATRDIGGSAE